MLISNRKYYGESLECILKEEKRKGCGRKDLQKRKVMPVMKE